jgi:hypothetical protein
VASFENDTRKKMLQGCFATQPRVTEKTTALGKKQRKQQKAKAPEKTTPEKNAQNFFFFFFFFEKERIQPSGQDCVSEDL